MPAPAVSTLFCMFNILFPIPGQLLSKAGIHAPTIGGRWMAALESSRPGMGQLGAPKKGAWGARMGAKYYILEASAETSRGFLKRKKGGFHRCF